MSKLLNAWMIDTTALQQERLAQLADTSRSYLYAISEGSRNASAGLAGRVERAVEMMIKEGHKVRPLPRHAISKDCNLCTYTSPGKR